FRVQDDGGTANGGIDTDASANTLTFDIAPVSDGLRLSNFAAGITFTEAAVNSAPVLIDSDVIFADPDQNFSGDALSVSGLLAEDLVAIRNQGSGAGQIIGSFAGGVGATLTVTLNAAATVASVDALIQNLTYANGSDTPTPSRTL